MVYKIILPKLSTNMEKGIIGKWLKKEGDKVEKGELLFELVTDKAVFEVEAEEQGFLRKIFAEEGEELVFVEVKARRSNAFGAPEDAVTEKKQEQVHAVAEGYLLIHDIDDRPCRFDIVAIEYRNGTAEIRHIRDAF